MKLTNMNNAIGIFVIILLLGLIEKTIAQENNTNKLIHSYDYDLISNKDIIEHQQLGTELLQNRSISNITGLKCKPNHYFQASKESINTDDTYLNDSAYYYRRDFEFNDLDLDKKHIYSYDANGKMIQDSRYDWDIDLNEWQPNYKNVYTYANDGNIYQNVVYFWDIELSDWFLFYKILFSYDTNGNLTEENCFSWNPELNEWQNNFKETYFYNINGNITEYSWMKWNPELNDWVGYKKELYSYDTNSNMIEWVVYDFDLELNDWIGKWKRDYTYDDSGNEIVKIFYIWNSELNEWGPDSKTLKSYNNGLQFDYFIYIWDSELSDWKIYRVDMFFYNSDDRLAEWLIFLWDYDINNWVENTKNEYTYNDKGDIILYITYEWDSGDWIEHWKYENLFDTNENRTKYITYDWNSSNNEWIVDRKEDYYWSLLVGINEITELEYFKIFPNPSSGNISFTSEELINKFFTLEIVNLYGQIVYSRHFNSSIANYNIDLPGISKGMYLLKIQGIGFLKTEKLVIE